MVELELMVGWCVEEKRSLESADNFGAVANGHMVFGGFLIEHVVLVIGDVNCCSTVQ